LFGVLNLGHWDLFEPALARLDWLIASSAVGFQLELIDTAGVNPVWARDLDSGAWILGASSFFSDFDIRFSDWQFVRV